MPVYVNGKLLIDGVNTTSGSATVPAYTFVSDSDTGIGSAGDDKLSLISGGLEGQRITEGPTSISAAIQNPSVGLDDITFGGTYTGNTVNEYVVTIDATGTPDTITWTVNGGGGDTGVELTGLPQSLGDGVTFTALATTGHTLNDAWTSIASTSLTHDFNFLLAKATGNELAFDFSGVVNKKTSGNATVFYGDFTDTNSPGSFNILEFKVGGVAKTTLSSDGLLTLDVGILTPYIKNSDDSTFTLQSNNFTSTDNAIEIASGTVSNTTGEFNSVVINTIINQASGDANNNILKINPTLTAEGSGGSNLIWAGHDDTDVFKVDSNGNVNAGKISGKVNTVSYSSSQTLSVEECTGYIVYVTGAATIKLQPVFDGCKVTIIVIGNIAVSLDPDDNDKLWLDGVALDDGDKATSGSLTGDTIVATYYSADGWYASSNSWTDGGV